MTGAHGIHPAGHEHARCRYCGRLDVHTAPVGGSSTVTYQPHNYPGDGVACTKSNNKTVRHEDRHQAAPKTQEQEQA